MLWNNMIELHEAELKKVLKYTKFSSFEVLLADCLQHAYQKEIGKKKVFFRTHMRALRRTFCGEATFSILNAILFQLFWFS